MANQIVMYKGNNLLIDMTIHDEENNDTPYNLTGCTVTLYIKKKSTDTLAFITKVGNIINPELGKVQFTILPNDTKKDFIFENSVFPVQVDVETANGEIYTALKTSAQFK